MKKTYFLLIVIILASACTSNSSKEEAQNDPVALEKAKRDSISAARFLGSWFAEWDTPPESYPEVTDMEFYMTGNFTFTQDSLTVTANGYPDCIFNVDTLSHTQSWRISNDTLFLINDPESPGMTYRITSREEERINLQLMEDIFVTLSK